MNDEESMKIAKSLIEKGVNLPCPRCGCPDFEVVGKTTIAIDDPGEFGLLCELIACSNCGFVTHHALRERCIKADGDCVPHPSQLIGKPWKRKSLTDKPEVPLK